MSFQTKPLTYQELETMCLDHAFEYTLVLGTIPPPVFTFLQNQDYMDTLKNFIPLQIPFVPEKFEGNRHDGIRILFPSGNHAFMQLHPNAKTPLDDWYGESGKSQSIPTVKVD